MDRMRSSGQFDLKALMLSNESGKSIDIRFLTNTFRLVESMSAGFLSGSIHIYDGIGILERFPLRGQETLSFHMVDFAGNEFIHDFILYGVDDVKRPSPNSDTMTEYNVYFVSKHRYINESVYIRRAYRNGLTSDYVKELFDGAFESDKPLVIDKTDNPFDLVAPGYTPLMTMEMFGRKSYSNKYQTGTYRFFETKKDFQFRNNEAIADEYKNGLRKAKLFTISQVEDKSPEGQLVARNNVIDFNFRQHVDSISDLQNGLYNRTVMELDYHNRQIVESNSKHLDNIDGYIFPEKVRDVHNREFDQVALHPAILLVAKNYASTHDPYSASYTRPTMTPDILLRRMAAESLYHGNMIDVKIYGDFGLNCGDMIELRFPVFENKTDKRDYSNPNNGFYFIDSIAHSFRDDNYYADLKLSRLGLKDFNGEANRPKATSN